MSKPMTLGGAVTISRTESSHGPAVIRITFRDVNSGTDFATATMTPADFALALTGYAAQPAGLDVRGLDRVGKHVERRSQEVACELPRDLTDPARDLVDPVRAAMINAALMPLEVEGWKAIRSGFDDWRRLGLDRAGREVWVIQFERWVERAEEVAP